MSTHPLIALFASRAELLDIQDSAAGLDEAVALLASWMEVTEFDLSEDDMAVLCDIGGMLYRIGLQQRLPPGTA